MAEIINLRIARRTRARAEAATTANANRVRFGRTKQEKQAAHDEETRRNSLLDGAKIDSPQIDGLQIDGAGDK